MTVERRSIVVTHRAGYKYRLMVFVLVAGLVGAGLGYWFGVENLTEINNSYEQLETEFNDMKITYADNKNQLEILRLNHDVDLAAIENARQEIIAMQQRIVNNEADLALYRELLGDTDQVKGLSVAMFNLEALGEQRYAYRWIARQKTAKMEVSNVIAHMFIIGTLDGEEVSLPLDRLDQQIDSLPLTLTLKYFSINQGILSLPDGFNPVKVRISLRYSWKKNDSYDQYFDWKAED